MAKANVGGGSNSRQVKQVSIRTGPPSTEKISPCGVSQIGQKFGNPQAIDPIKDGTMKQVPLGPTVAVNSKSSPGQGRDIHRSGSQAQTGTGGPARPDGGNFFDGFNK